MDTVLITPPSSGDEIITKAREEVNQVLALKGDENSRIAQIKQIVHEALNQVQNRLNDSESLVALLKTENDLQTRTVEAAWKSRNVLRQRVDELTQLHEELQAKTEPFFLKNQQLDERYKALLSQTEAQDKEQESLANRIKNLGEKTHTLSDTTSGLKSSYEKLNRTVIQQRDTTKTLEDQSKQFLKECEDLHKFLQNLDTHTKQLDGQSKTLTHESSSLQGSFKNLQGQTEGLIDVTEKMKNKYDALQMRFKNLNGGTRQLKILFDKISLKYKSLQTHYEKLGKKTGHLKTQYDAIGRDYTTLSEKFTSLNSETKKLNTITFEMGKQYTVFKGDFSTMKERTEGLEKQIDLLKLSKERKQFVKTHDKLSKPIGSFIGCTIGTTLLFLSFSFMNALIFGMIVWKLSEFTGRQGLYYYRNYKLSQHETEYLKSNPTDTPRQAFEHAKTECHSYKNHPLFHLIW